MSNDFLYRDRRLPIARYADIPYELRPGGPKAELVQRLLETVTPWRDGDNPIETRRFDYPIAPMAIPVPSNVRITWGVHRGHKARHPQLSPFIEVRSVPQQLKGLLTIELEGSAEQPLLTRAYGGDYTPPLPWMTSAKDADGGKAACIRFWREHAYLHRGGLIKPGSTTRTPPAWYTGN